MPPITPAPAAPTAGIQKNDIDTILAAGAAMGSVIKDHGGTPAVLLRGDYRVHDLEALLPWPSRIRCKAVLQSVGSFVDYVNRFKGPNTLIFADVGEKSLQLSALLDYHYPGSEEVTSRASWVGHTASYVPTKTPEWTRLIGSNGAKMAQQDFAVFLENNLTLFRAPNGSELLELVTTLEGKSNVRFDSAIRLQSGAAQLRYEEDVELRGSGGTTRGVIEVPAELVLGVAPFVHGPAYQLTSRLRYRIESKKLIFWYELREPERVIRDVAESVLAEVAEKTALSVLHGTVEL